MDSTAFESLVLEPAGVRDDSLPSQARATLDERGFVVLPDLLSADALRELRCVFEDACNMPIDAGRAETGTRHPTDLSPLAVRLEACLSNATVLAGIHHILERPFQVLHFGGRDPLPGFGAQGLHTDWMPRHPSEPYAVATALWTLDSFTPSNGATRVIPGSHRCPAQLPKSQRAPTSRHVDEQLVSAQAGSVLLLNGHLWHSGTRNDSSDQRRVIQIQFVATALRPPHAADFTAPADLTGPARHLLGAP